MTHNQWEAPYLVPRARCSVRSVHLQIIVNLVALRITLRQVWTDRRSAVFGLRARAESADRRFWREQRSEEPRPGYDKSWSAAIWRDAAPRPAPKHTRRSTPPTPKQWSKSCASCSLPSAAVSRPLLPPAHSRYPASVAYLRYSSRALRNGWCRPGRSE